MRRARGERMLRIFFFLAAFFLSSAGARAVTLEAFDSKGVAFVGLTGEIRPGDADKAIAALALTTQKHKADQKIVGLALNSPGGAVFEAVKIGEFVENAKIPVVVAQRSNCESACFFIFMSSPAKFVAHGARIGVHSISLDGKENGDTAQLTMKIGRLARAAGVPQSVIGKMVTAEPGEMHYLSDAELKQMGAYFLDDDESPGERSQTAAGAPPATSQGSRQQSQQQPSGSVSYGPGQPPPPDVPDDERLAALKAEQDANFDKYWKQILSWSKAQHGGRLAAERRCGKSGCALIVAYFDRQQRYVEAWRYEEPPKGSGVKLVCRQAPGEAQRLSCKDWYDEHEFMIGYTHQIGEDFVSYGGDLFDIFK